MYAGNEGRAGMAAIVLKQDHKLNGAKLYNHLVKTLPAYAWPWFLRIQVSHAGVHYLQGVFFSVKSHCSFVSLPAFSDRSGCYGDLQAAEGEAGPGGFQSGRHPGSSLFLGCLPEGLHSPDCIFISRHCVRKDQFINIVGQVNAGVLPVTRRTSKDKLKIIHVVAAFPFVSTLSSVPQ